MYSLITATKSSWLLIIPKLHAPRTSQKRIMNHGPAISAKNITDRRFILENLTAWRLVSEGGFRDVSPVTISLASCTRGPIRSKNSIDPIYQRIQGTALAPCIFSFFRIMFLSYPSFDFRYACLWDKFLAQLICVAQYRKCASLTLRDELFPVANFFPVRNFFSRTFLPDFLFLQSW